MSGTVRESPADFRNGDLISRLLAATPPYQTNSTFVPPGLYFSEMLKRFVQAKSCAPSLPNKRGRKRSWKDATAAAVNNNNKAELHLQQPPTAEPKQKKPVLQDFVPIRPPLTAQPDPPFPLWYPPFYPGPAYPPVYFKTPEAEPLNLQIRSDPLKQDRHYSAFRVPEPSSKPAGEHDEKAADNRRGTSYLMGNLTKIYRYVAPDEERTIIDVEGDGPEVAPTAAVSVAATEEVSEKKDCNKDLTALIGLELVVDYVKHGNDKNGQNEQNVKCCQNS